MKGIGTDIVEINRIKSALKKYPKGFKNKIFTKKEWEYCFDKKNPYPSLAVRFAAKEAVFKALGIGMGICKWKDIEICIEKTGKPYINLSGKAAKIAKSLSIIKIDVSLSHCKKYAIAFVVSK